VWRERQAAFPDIVGKPVDQGEPMRMHFRGVRLALEVALIATSFSTAAGTIHVNSTASPNSGFCTFSQAIYAANLDASTA